MHYALKITDEYNYTIVEHLANYSDDVVHTDIDELPQQEWRKAHYLITWVKENKPDWKIDEREIKFPY